MKRQIKSIRILVTGAAFLAMSAGLRADFRAPAPGAAALGRGGGNIAMVDDGAAIAINPGRLPAIGNAINLEISGTGVNAGAEFTSMYGEKVNSKEDWKYLGSIFVSGPLHFEDFAIDDVHGPKIFWGLGVHTPYGLSSVVDKDSSFKYSQPHSTKLAFVDIAPTVAYRVDETLSAGVALDIAYSSFQVEQSYPWAMATGGAYGGTGDMKFNGDGWGIGATLGVAFRWSEHEEIGLRLRLPMKVSYSGDFKINNVPGGFPASNTSDYSTELKFPMEAGIGYKYEFSDRLALGVDVEWIQYSQMSSYDFSVGVNDHLMPSTSVPLNLQDSWNIAAGVEWEFAKNWKLRAGYRYEQTPVPDEYFTLSIPGADQHIGSIGVGYESENWRFAIAYAHSFFDTRKIRNNVVEAVNGDYDFFYNMLTLTLGYRF